MDLRPYHANDHDAVLALFDSHPALTGREAFASELAGSGEMLVAEHNGQIVAWGGYQLAPGGARLLGVLVHRALTGQGVGKYVLLSCLRSLGRANVPFVEVETPAAAAAFFGQFAFRPVREEAGRVWMVMKAQVCP
jgi:N-acetylglutamate synthase-like GNAT family acetyltransferase